ncbi:hypothetical protein [Enhygromyxa salina]|nr:hypothetical protein [Enhygromyxa salina]
MGEQTDDDAPGDEGTFHEVVFGEGADEERLSFAQFRDLSLRKRVRLLMSKRSQFFGADGAEIPRDVAMRFGKRAGSGAAPAAPAAPVAPSGDEGQVDRLIRLLRDSSLEHELRGCVKLAEQIEVTDEQQRAALATALLRTIKLLEDDHGSTPLSWAAIRRFGSLVPTTRLTELAVFLQPGNEAETMQATLQAIWHALSVDQDFGLAILAVRTRQLLNKYLDPDWLCTPLARALTTDLLLAYSVLTPSTDEHGLRALFNRARSLGQAIPLELARAEIDEALAHAREHGRPIAARLQLLSGLCKFG